MSQAFTNDTSVIEHKLFITGTVVADDADYRRDHLYGLDLCYPSVDRNSQNCACRASPAHSSESDSYTFLTHFLLTSQSVIGFHSQFVS